MPDWKDTVMNDKQLEQVEEAYLDEDFSVNFIRLGRGHTEELRLRVAQAQAEITWSIASQIAVKAVLEEIENFHRLCGRQDMNELAAWQSLKQQAEANK